MPGWVNDENAALLTDLYQLTMLQAYYVERLEEEAVFDLFARRLRERNYLVFAGLDTVLHYLATVCFPRESLDYLATLGLFRTEFLDWLAGFRFTGDVYAFREGTPFFADEPVLQVVAPLPQAQLVETFLLNQITFQSGIASKASRVLHAAKGRTVIDFGLRRMHGTDAGMKAARACFVAGIDATSNVLAAKAYGMTPSGTMAHSYITIHGAEEQAFVNFAQLYPGTTLLVDTYDTIAAVRRIVELSRRLGDAFRVGAIRLDSGDVAALAREARTVLDAGGLRHVKIFASGSLDEYSVAKLVDSGAPLDGFGVGTKLGTIEDRPYLDSVYKLAEYAGTGRMKLSQQKSNLPGRKQVYRFFEHDRAVRDVIGTLGEQCDGVPMLECVMQGGTRTDAGRMALRQVQEHARATLAYLPDHLLELEQADPPYQVEISAALRRETEAVRTRLTEQAAAQTRRDL